MSTEGWSKDISGASASCLEREVDLAGLFVASRPMPLLRTRPRPPWMNEVDRQRELLWRELPALQEMDFLDHRAIEALWDLRSEHAATFARCGDQIPSLLEEWRDQPLFLDRYWDALPFLYERICAVPPEVVRGVPVGQDFGFGPPRLHSSVTIRRLAEALQGWPVERVGTRVDDSLLDVMEEERLYPGRWTRARIGPLLERYGASRALFEAAAKRGRAVLTVVE